MNMSGGNFTWSNKRAEADCVQEKLDRVFINPFWNSLFPFAQGIALPAILSDYIPIVIRLLDRSGKRKSTFKFESKWLQDGECDEVDVLTNKTKNELHELEKEVDKLLAMEEQYWHQRSRVKWLNFGDRNTKFFHATTIQRRRTNTIRRLKGENGQWIENTESLKKHIVDHFDEQFHEKVTNKGNEVLDLIDRNVTDTMNRELEKEVTEEEIRKATFDLGAFKAPGPDGFSGIFFQKFWETIKNEVCELVKTFFREGVMQSRINKANLIMIPKTSSPKTIHEFRPIGCCNFIYKIIARIMTSRLKPLMPYIISPSQTAFVPGRQIQDNIVIAQEAFHAIKRRTRGKKGIMAIKLDLAKAYDKVSWAFLRQAMERMGFSDYWIRRTMEWRPTLLSPFLFNFVANAFSTIFCKAEQEGNLRGYRIKPRCPSLSHLLFADDCLLFAEADPNNAKVISEGLELFEEASGQTFNLNKSAIFFSPNTRHSDKYAIMAFLGNPVMELDSKYLGIPMIWGRGKKAALAFIKDRIVSRISSWKGRFLSQAGKEVLIKAVVSAMPTYFMHCFKIPITFCNDLNLILNRFWWKGADISKNNIHWTTWDKLAVSKNKGGMGFRDFQAFNMALLAKQAWRLLHNPEAKWVQILKGIYFPFSNPLSVPKCKQGSWAWNSLQEGLSFLSQDIRWNIGNGNGVMIWENKWIPTLPSFKISSPRPTGSNFYLVKQLINESSWNIPLLQTLFSEEEVKAICQIPLSFHHCADSLVWHPSKNRDYIVKLGYQRLMQNKRQNQAASSSRQEEGNETIWSNIWSLKTLPKIRNFIWKACHNVVPSNENLARRRHSNTAGCLRCGDNTESIEHIIFFCPFSQAIWRASTFHYSPALMGFGSFASWWQEMGSLFKENDSFSSQSLLAWTVWGIWKARNAWIFERSCDSPVHVWNAIFKDFTEYQQLQNVSLDSSSCP
ncbi:hypothetical protein GQ457_14G012230 [Hibiscus cannabinus]